MGEVTGQDARLARQREGVQDAEGILSEHPVGRRKEIPGLRVSGENRDLDIFKDREGGVDGAALKRPDHPAARDGMGRQSSDVLPLEDHLP